MKTQEENLDCPFDFTSRCTLGRCDCKSKQETLEEVAKSHAIYELENNYKPTKESFKLACKRNFIRGVKWQAERMYSEEEVKDMLQKRLQSVGIFSSKEATEVWFKQYKKQ